jgi:hypothetical protein
VCFAYFGFSSGGTLDKRKAWVLHYQDRRKANKLKFLNQLLARDWREFTAREHRCRMVAIRGHIWRICGNWNTSQSRTARRMRQIAAVKY